MLSRRPLWARVLLCIGDRRLNKRSISGVQEKARQREPGGNEIRWTECLAEDRQLFVIKRSGVSPHAVELEARDSTDGRVGDGRERCGRIRRTKLKSNAV